MPKANQLVCGCYRLLRSIVGSTPVSPSGSKDIRNDAKVTCGVQDFEAIPVKSGGRRPSNPEVDELEQLEKQLENYCIFLDKLTDLIEEWMIATSHSVESLQQWGITFGAVFGRTPSSSMPHDAYQAFVSLVSSLPELCSKLEEDTQATVIQLLRKVRAMAKRPQLLIDKMHTLELSASSSARFRHSDLSVLSTLLAELPVLLRTMDRATGLALRIMMQKQVAFLEAVTEKWNLLLHSLIEEGERCGGAEETLRAWRARWEVGRQELLIWEQRYASGDSSTMQPATLSETTLSMGLTLAGLPPTNDRLTLPRFTLSKASIGFSHPPSSLSSSWSSLSVMDAACVLYTVRALRSYHPPPHDPYQGYSFFTLVDGDLFGVLQEYDHPSRHSDLPRCFVDRKSKDCLLMVRARNSEFEGGGVGWILARFVRPVD